VDVERAALETNRMSDVTDDEIVARKPVVEKHKSLEVKGR